MSPEAQLHEAALVVAHPDDEILWFSSIVERVAKLVICFQDVPEEPAWTAGRAAAAARFPLHQAEFLGLTESVAFAAADWQNPIPSGTGLELNSAQERMPGFSAARYASNFESLVETLQERLAGHAHVFTHNPWGEYGHEEHVQVYRAVRKVQQHLGFQLWYDNYASDRSSVLMTRTISGTQPTYVSFPTNLTVARQLEALYRQTDCWTWPFDDYPYFQTECMVLDQQTAQAQPREGSGATLPINYVDVDGGHPPPTALREQIKNKLTRRFR